MHHRSVAVLIAIMTTTVAVAAGNGAGIRAYEGQNYAKAVEKLTPAAEKGDAEAQYYLALSLRAQLPKPQGKYAVQPSETDPAQQTVHGWLEKSAAQGHVAAQRELADSFDSGFGVQVDYARALELMQKASDAGDERARTTLTSWYSIGHIVAPDLAKAADMRKFAALASGDAQSKLDAYKKVLEAAKDYLDAKAAASDKFSDEELANAGDPRAATRLGNRSVRDKEKKDCAAAAKWYERAGELGDGGAFEVLGAHYYRGECGLQDFAKAHDAYQRGAAVGDTGSLRALANMELFGHGKASDYVAAYAYLKTLELTESLSYAAGALSFATRQLSAEQRAVADAKAATLEPQLRKAIERTKTKEMTRPVKSEGDANSPFSYSLAMVDRRGVCAQNYLNKCSYVPFETQLEIRNGEPVTLDCKLQISAKFFPAPDTKVITRRYIIRPSMTKKPVIGTIAGEVDAAASGVTCERVPQPSVANGTCVLEAAPGSDPSKYYSKEAQKAGQQGDVTIAVTMKDASGIPADVQVEKSSGVPAIDQGATDFARATAFDTNCPGERMLLPLAFKLR